MDIVMRDVDNYLREIEALDRFDAEVERIVEEMTGPGGECFPYDPDNFVLALADADVTNVVLMLASGRMSEAGVVVDTTVRAYWTAVATERARQELTNRN